eukprot:9049258-Ditylum_brightwellii.AAC.1
MLAFPPSFTLLTFVVCCLHGVSTRLGRWDGISVVVGNDINGSGGDDGVDDNNNVDTKKWQQQWH